MKTSTNVSISIDGKEVLDSDVVVIVGNQSIDIVINTFALR